MIDHVSKLHIDVVPNVWSYEDWTTKICGSTKKEY